MARGFRIDNGVAYVGDVAYPDAVVRCDDGYPDLRIIFRGFHLRLESGWVVSAQWGSFNYCANHYSHFERTVEDLPDDEIENTDDPIDFLEECPNAEIAAWKRFEDEWYKFPNGDTVHGWTSPEYFHIFVNALMTSL